ncbi:tyrosine-type recombinase/integrase [Ponticaulis sp.]|uniref:tyrosine-type recombinase/integrase n=1 Tax=Ponticaulis sp. TaxID=2020902 RepID=UPI0025EBE4C4|nr:tyrosine-type recombinase/integrase [Ponticaulis sp.]
METEDGIYTTTGERKYLTVSERERFVEEASKEDLATFAFCLLLCLTGCRVSEALALKVTHIDRELRCVRYLTLKRRSKVVWRSVPIPNQLVETLVRLPVAEDGKVFQFSRSTAWRRVVMIMERAGIAGAQACPRGLRHYFGVFADSQGIPQPVLQRWMGHAKLESTAIYRQAVGEEEQSLAERLCWLMP